MRRLARSAPGQRPPRPRASPRRRSTGANQANFDQVWELVRDRFYDPHLNGLDWEEQRVRFRPQVASTGSPEDAAAMINTMLAKLGASHTHYYTPEDPAYYQLADIFVGALEHRGLERVFAKGTCATRELACSPRLTTRAEPS